LVKRLNLCNYNIKYCPSIPLLKLNVFDTLLQTFGTFMILTDQRPMPTIKKTESMLKRNCALRL
jgi:hypothetical protein